MTTIYLIRHGAYENPYKILEISDGDSASWALRSLMFERDKFTPDEISRCAIALGNTAARIRNLWLAW